MKKYIFFQLLVSKFISMEKNTLVGKIPPLDVHKFHRHSHWLKPRFQRRLKNYFV